MMSAMTLAVHSIWTNMLWWAFMHLMSEDLRIIIGMAFAVHNNIHGEKIPIKTPKKSLWSDKKMRRDTPLKKNHS